VPDETQEQHDATYTDAEGCRWRVTKVMRSGSAFGPYVLPSRVVLRFELDEITDDGPPVERFAFNVPLRWKSRRVLEAACRDSLPG